MARRNVSRSQQFKEEDATTLREVVVSLESSRLRKLPLLACCPMLRSGSAGSCDWLSGVQRPTCILTPRFDAMDPSALRMAPTYQSVMLQLPAAARRQRRRRDRVTRDPHSPSPATRSRRDHALEHDNSQCSPLDFACLLSDRVVVSACVLESAVAAGSAMACCFGSESCRRRVLR